MIKRVKQQQYFIAFTFYIVKLTFCLKTYLEKISIVTFVLQLFCVTGYWKCSNKTPTPICIGLVDAVLRLKILGNRVGILGILT